MKITKAFMVIVLICIALMSFIAIGTCLWAAWAMYLARASKACVFMCAIAATFAAYQVRVVFKNKREILNDIKEVWHG